MLPLFIKQKLKHYPLIVKVWNLVHCHKSQPSISGPISYGDENPDKTFYVICRNDKAGGAWSLLAQMLTHFAYAIDNGYVPIVDMKNFRNQYVSDEDFRKVNIWERFFEQPFGYTLDDISRSKNVIISSGQDIFDEFSKAFGNKLFSIAQNRIRKKAMSGKEWLSAERSRLFPEEDKNMSFLSYFTSTYILSQCDYFFAGRNAGSAGVLIMPHNFSKCVLYKLGRY